MTTPATAALLARTSRNCALGLLLACAVLPASAKPAAPNAAAANPAARADLAGRCSGGAALPGKLALQLGKSAMMRLPEAVAHRSVGNPEVVQAMLVAPDTMYIAGIDIGTTNMLIQGKSGACNVIDIVVSMDVSAVQATLAALMPEEKDIRVTAAADSIVLSGVVADAAAVARAQELAGIYVRQQLHPLQVARKGGDPTAVADGGPGGGAGGGASAASEARVINMLSVGAPQQVMLEVKIAEVSKSLLERLEGGTTLRYAGGSWATTVLANFLTGTAKGMFDARKSNGNQFTVDAQKTDGLVRILAEPTVMAISGQEGSFLAGGKIFIPVAQDNNKITLEEREFGVGLRFTPTVLAGGRINIKVAPEVSELAREGVGISASGFSGAAIIPVITTRRATTTVQLYDGQSFAIGGLIKNNQISNIKGLPGLGEVPVLGALFRSTDYQQDRTELVFVITPHLVKPLPANFTLPTDKVTPATRTGLLLGGKLEGKRPAAAGAAPAPDDGRDFELK